MLKGPRKAECPWTVSGLSIRSQPADPHRTLLGVWMNPIAALFVGYQGCRQLPSCGKTRDFKIQCGELALIYPDVHTGCTPS
jgi:hypothetical protein